MIGGLTKLKEYDTAYLIWKDMSAKNFEYNEFILCVTIELFSQLNKPEEAIQFYERFNFDSNYVNSCLIKMLEKHQNYDMVPF